MRQKVKIHLTRTWSIVFHFFFPRRTVYYYPRMGFDDIRVFRSRVISKLFCVRGNCYGNFNGQTTGGCHEHAESCRRFEIVHKRLQRVSGAELLLHRETIRSWHTSKIRPSETRDTGPNLLIIYRYLRYRPSKTECLVQIPDPPDTIVTEGLIAKALKISLAA